MSERELISQAEFARRRGVSRQAVSKAVKQGRIELVAGKIDPVAANQAWERSSDPARGANAPAQELGEGRGRRKRPGSEPEAENLAARTFQDSRAEREAYLARLARLDFLERSGALVSLDQVKRAAFDGARRARDLLQAMADRLAPELAGLQDPEDCHRIIDQEVKRACQELSRVVPR